MSERPPTVHLPRVDADGAVASTAAGGDRSADGAAAAVGPSPWDGALDTARPLGLYVHVPFCTVRCPYCDFAVDTRADIPHRAFAEAVAREIEARAPYFVGGPLRSIYFGGGTPGLLEADAVGVILASVRRAFAVPASALTDGSIEITLEANPGDLDPERLRALRAHGVARLSFGVQSLDDGELRALGRHHDAAAVAPALAAARAAGFGNLCVDLMFGIPGQTAASWARSLAGVVALGPEHVSAYALTIERGTEFGRRDRAGQLVRPGDDEAAARFDEAREVLEAAGFEHYEVSSYARPGRRSRHNGLYWSGGAYLGVGPGAASFRPLAGVQGAGAAGPEPWAAVRWTNPRALDTYFRAAERGRGNPAPAKVEGRTRADLEEEALWLGLRTEGGIDRAGHRAGLGRDVLDGRTDAAERCVKAGWLTVEPDRVRLTRAGMLLADEVVARLWAGDRAPRPGGAGRSSP